MEIIKIAPTLAITVLLTACDSTSSSSRTFDSGKANKSTIKPDKKNSAESVSTDTTEPKIQQNPNTTDWAPLITETPSKQFHEPFLIPKKKIENIRYFFQKKKQSTYKKLAI